MFDYTQFHPDIVRVIEDAVAYGVPVADAIRDAVNDAVNGYDVVENADGSAHAVPATVTARPATDTTRVVTRYADGTVTVARQTVLDALTVVVEGQRRALELVESGEMDNYADDVADDIIAE
jgi:hypothetical protein